MLWNRYLFDTRLHLTHATNPWDTLIPILQMKKKFNYLSKVTKPVSGKFVPKPRFWVPNSLKIKMRKRMHLRSTVVTHWPRPHSPGPHRVLPGERAPAVTPPGVLSTACLRRTVLAYQAMLPSLFWQETRTGLKDLLGLRPFGGYEKISKDGPGGHRSSREEGWGVGGKRVGEQCTWRSQKTMAGDHEAGVMRVSPEREAGWVRRRAVTKHRKAFLQRRRQVLKGCYQGMTWCHQSSGETILEAACKVEWREQSWQEECLGGVDGASGAWAGIMPVKAKKRRTWETTEGWSLQNRVTSVELIGEKKTSRMPSSFLAWGTKQTAVFHWGTDP